MDTNNKDKLDDILKEMNVWIDDELKTKGFIIGSEVHEHFIKEYREFIANEVSKPWKRPDD